MGTWGKRPWEGPCLWKVGVGALLPNELVGVSLREGLKL